MAQLILLRHGESEWNKKNIFTGWVDIPLSLDGIQEALRAGEQIAHVPIDYIFVSYLVRSQQTALIAMTKHQGGKVPRLIHPDDFTLKGWDRIFDDKEEKNCIPVQRNVALNERMYGRLQGLNKDQARQHFGEAQVHSWRRSYDQAPPEGESLKMTAERVLPFFKNSIIPLLEKEKNVFISAHGNSLRALVMFIENLSAEQIVSLELSTGVPLFYSYEGKKWKKL
jgi:2,3-bisphosphoglycerate-dependent phosphoglycerate mutase